MSDADREYFTGLLERLQRGEATIDYVLGSIEARMLTVVVPNLAEIEHNPPPDDASEVERQIG